MKQQLFLLPGLMCDERLWCELMPYLEDKYELIYLSIPNESNLDSMVESLSQTLPKEKVNLLGFSLGGYIASYFASVFTHRLSKLMIVSATGCDLPQEEIEKRKNLINMRSSFVLKELSRQKVLTLLDKKHHHNEDMISLIQQMYKQLGQKVFIQQLQGTLHRKDVASDLKHLNIPISFLYAKGDRLVNKNWLEQLQSCKHIEQVVLPIESHMLPLEEPLLTANHINHFFS